jgi:hypothetical protein
MLRWSWSLKSWRGAATRVGWRPSRGSDGLIGTAPRPDRPWKGAEEGWSGTRLPAQGSSRGTTCPRSSGSHLSSMMAGGVEED